MKDHLIHPIKLCMLLCTIAQMPNWVSAQERVKEAPAQIRHSGLFLEIGGNALIYSINYDYRFSKHLSGRIGGGASPAFSGPGTKLMLPLMLSYLSGEGKSHVELGIGTTVGIDIAPNFTKTDVLLTTTFGYRFQPPNGGFLFRIGLTPFFGTTDIVNISDKVFQVWGGISLGYTFR